MLSIPAKPTWIWNWSGTDTQRFIVASLQKGLIQIHTGVLRHRQNLKDLTSGHWVMITWVRGNGGEGTNELSIISAVQDLIDLTSKNNVICNCTGLVIVSIYQNPPYSFDIYYERNEITTEPAFRLTTTCSVPAFSTIFLGVASGVENSK